MFSKSLFGTVLLFASSFAFAQAGSDCGSNANRAVQSCKARLDRAKQSAVSASGTGINGGGGSQAVAAYQIRGEIEKEINKCSNEDLQTCTNSCTEALQDAEAKNNTALAERINSIMKECDKRIDNHIASARQTQEALTQVAQQSNDSSSVACAEGDVCTKKDPNIHNVVACGTGYFSYNGGCEPNYFYGGRRNPLAPK